MGRSLIKDDEREEVARFVEKHWHSRMVMSRGRSYYPHKEKGIVERRDGEIVGLLTFRIGDGDMEILTLNSTISGQRIGTALVLQSIDIARHGACGTIWLTTTNDNLRAMGFYQRLGFRITAVNVGAVDEARKIKSQIPEIGLDGIAIHDEIVMTLELEPFLPEAVAGESVST